MERRQSQAPISLLVGLISTMQKEMPNKKKLWIKNDYKREKKERKKLTQVSLINDVECSMGDPISRELKISEVFLVFSSQSEWVRKRESSRNKLKQEEEILSHWWLRNLNFHVHESNR